jgi:2-polyprenyl-3-methyl-5-hydroxy-6-metoxy-1,4-benzoquinol methylase
MRQSIPCDDCLMSGEEGPGGAVSGAGVALATYINKNAPPGRQTKDKSIPWRGMNVLELGSGTGVAGIAAAAEGATVLLTDKDDLMPLMAKNIRLNEDNMLFGSADYEAFDWAEPPPREVSKEAWDVVLCAESVTRSDDVPLFVSTLASLLSPDGAAAGATAIYAHNPMDAQSPDLDLQLQTAFKSHGLSRKSLPSLASQTTKQSCGDVECGRCPEVELDTVELWTLHSSSV